MIRVLVTGATGHAGGHLARRLSEGGLVVRALVRTDEQAVLVRQQGWEAARGDLANPGTLSTALEGVELVLHAAAYAGDSRPLAEAINVAGSRELADRALQAGVRGFVHISTLSVHGDPIPPNVDEDSPLAVDHPDLYCSTKAIAEVELGKVRSRGLPVTILRAGMITHWVRSQWGDEMLERIRSNGWPPGIHPDDVMPWVHTMNLAEMSWLALKAGPAASDTFVAADRNVSFREFYGPVAAALGRPIFVPDRRPEISSARVGKIASTLGYRPVYTFEETVDRLVQIARRPERPRAGAP